MTRYSEVNPAEERQPRVGRGIQFLLPTMTVPISLLFHGVKLLPTFFLRAVGNLQFPFRPPSVPAPKRSCRRACLPPPMHLIPSAAAAASRSHERLASARASLSAGQPMCG